MLANQLSHKGSQISHANSSPDVLTARLHITADPRETLRINPVHVFAHQYGEGAPFITTENVQQRKNGLAAAIIGEPGIVVDREKGIINAVDASGLLDLYEAEGKKCLEKLQGSWAIVIADPESDRVIMAIDRMGRQALYFRIGRDSVLIGSSLDHLRCLAVGAECDKQILYNYIYFHVVPSPGAVMQRFNKLGAALVLELTPECSTLERYWTPDFIEKSPLSEADAYCELQSRLRTAVNRCASGYKKKTIEESGKRTEKVGAFLSGGLDSSTVAGMLSKIEGGSCDAYAIGFDAEGYDEMAFARITAKHFGIRLHEYYVVPDDVVEALPKIAAGFDEPFGNSSMLPAYFCARMASKDGINVLLAGDGGDELFAGNERYAHQKIFEKYQGVPHWLRSLMIEPLVKKALPENFPLVSKGRSFLRQANIPLPARLQYYSFLEQYSPDQVFKPGFLQQVDRSKPLELLNNIYKIPDNATALNRMLFLDWQITLADNDLRKVTQACALAGVSVRYPMLDDDLVEFSTTIPSAWKLPDRKKNGYQLRSFYKEALKGWLPQATLDKSKHGFGLPFGVWMKSHKPLQEMAYENIIRLKERDIFENRFLDEAIDGHRNEHAAYFGEMIWVLMSLELWLTANQPDYYCE